MRARTALVSGLLLLFLGPLLYSQDVTELAKKEKERRASLKGKAVTVITNKDLAKLKKRPAVEVAEASKPTSTVQPQAAAGDAKNPATPPPAEQKPPVEPQPPDPKALADKEYNDRLTALTDKAGQAQEMIDLLTLKMNSLWQEFYGLDDVKTRDLVKTQISETYEKLMKAQGDAEKAKKELDDFMAANKKEGTPPIWIK